MENKNKVEYLTKEKQIVCNQTRIPIIDVNGKYISINPFELTVIINNFDYPDTICLRSESKDIFIHSSYNKVFTNFIEVLQNSNFNNFFSKNNPWTNILPFPNGYNKYRKQLKLLIFRIDYYRSYLNLTEKNIVVDLESIINKLGINYQILEDGVSNGINFWNCENVPEVLPPYFMVYDMNKVDFNFHGSMLDKETLDSIKNYML